MHAALNDDRHEDTGPYLLGAALAALILPALVLGLSTPLWLGVVAALIVLVGTVATARLQHRAQTVQPAPTSAPAHAALADAEPALERLDRAARAIRTFAVRVQVGRIADATRLMIARVSAEPAALATVQRVLTYYLPRAAAITESYRVLEARGGEPVRLARIAALITRLDAAFQHYVARLANDALRLLDVELRLVDEALNDDLGDRQGDAT